MAFVLTGAVIVEDRGSLISYRKRCGSCGYIEGGSTTSSAPLVGAVSVGSFTCQKCRSINELRIQG